MSVDKALVREDYLRGFSVRMLSTKYGVPKSTVNDWIKRYGWVQEGKSKYVDTRQAIKKTIKESDSCPKGTPDTRSCPDASDKPLELAPLMPASREYSLIKEYTMKLLKKADDLLDLDDALAPRDLKSLSSMLMDVRQLLNTMSPLEEEERRLRLAALKKQTEETAKNAEVTVRFVNTEGSEG